MVSNILSVDGQRGELFNYDVVDFTRQYLQNMIDLQYILIMDGYQNGIREKVIYHSKLFLNMIGEMDRILSCDENFLLGKWLEAAKSMPGYSTSLEYNARNQITLWGPRGEINNYAIKQWAGLIKDFVYPRWELFWIELAKAMDNETIFDEIAVRKRIFVEIEEPFNNDQKKYNTKGSCNPSEVASEIFKKFENLYIDQKTLDKYLNENAKLLDPEHKLKHNIEDQNKYI